MNFNESILSTSSSAPPNLARIVANVVDMQHHIVTQFQGVTASLEAMKLEHHQSIQSLREDLRRTDDRAQETVRSLQKSHEAEIERLRADKEKEIERLMEMMKISTPTKEKDAAPNKLAPSQQSYFAAQSPSSFFGPPAGAQPTDPQQMMLQEYQRNLFLVQQQHIMQQQAQAQLLATAAARASSQPPPVIPGVTPAAPSQTIASATSLAASVGAAAVPAPSMIGIAKPAVTLPTPSVITPPRPAIGTVNLPIVSSPLATINNSKPAVIPPPIVPAVKKEEAKPALGLSNPATAPAAAKPVLTFGSASVTVTPGTPSSSLFQQFKPSTLTQTPPAKTEVKKEADEEHDDDDHAEEFEPQVEFAPVIPLPELVQVVTGEESETVLFEERCKLFRFAETKEWKERGTGIIKILKNPKTGRCRIVMRREQVHKVCANHQLSAGMTIKRSPKNEKSVLWSCMDYTEEKMQHEQLTAKFASVEIADKFRETFEEGVANDASGGSKDDKNGNVDVKLDDLKISDSKKDTKKDEKPKAAEPAKPASGFGDAFKPKAGSWECSGCYVSCAADETKCQCCGTNKDGTQGEKELSSITKFSSGITPAAGTPKFSFGLSAAAAAKEPLPTPTPSKSGASFGGSLTSGIATGPPKTSSPAPTFGSNTKGFGAPAFGASSIFGGAAKPLTAAVAAKKDEDASVASPSPVSFSFKSQSQALGSGPSTPISVFGGKPLFGGSANSTPKTEAENAAAPAEEKKETTKVFGSGFSGFASAGAAGSNPFASASKGKSIFDQENVEKAKAQFSSLPKSKISTIGTKKDDENDEEEGAEGEGEGEDFVPNAEFAPVIPLPELVNVVTGEEDEEVVFKARAKLFRYDNSTKENKERGVGDVKILKSKEGKYRVVMRREQVHKLCANFYINPSIELKPKKNLPNVYSWLCRDYAENVDGSDEIFNIKFKTEALAKEFADKFKEAQDKLQESSA